MKTAPFLFLLISLVILSCEGERTNQDIIGFWVAIPNDSIGNTGVIHFNEDSVVLYPHGGFQIKAAYKVHGDKIHFNGLKWFHFDEIYADSSSVEFKLRNDTLIWQNDWGLVKSKFDSYTEHFANSKGLRINLPESNFYQPTMLSQTEFLDFFIGFDKNEQLNILINDEPSELFDTYNRIKQLQDTIHYKQIVVRIFADKNVDISHIHDIHAIMKNTGIESIQYVTTNPSRHPYGFDFPGIKMRITNVKIKVIDDI